MNSGESLIFSAPSDLPIDVERVRTFVYGGVRFELSLGPGLDFQLLPFHEDFCWDDAPHIARVDCAAFRADELKDEARGRELSWERRGLCTEIRSAGVRAELRELKNGRFAATALMADSSNAAASLISGLGSSIVQAMGGFVLHASVVEIDGRGFAFVGPSGAGKSTAASLCEGGRWLARDRAAIFPHAGGYWVAGIGGGEPTPKLMQSPLGAAPLGGIFRIRHGQTRPSIRPLSAARRLVALRESVQEPLQDASAEKGLMNRLLHADGRLRVEELQTVLGQPLTLQLLERP